MADTVVLTIRVIDSWVSPGWTTYCAVAGPDSPPYIVIERVGKGGEGEAVSVGRIGEHDALAA